MQYEIPKGTFDIFPETQKAEWKWRESNSWAHLEEVIRKLVKEYGYQEIRTPIFERTELFTRSVGETSDIISKEMYTFIDKGSRSMTLRPEGTAAVMRAFVQGGLQQYGSIHKLFYIGPFFRYARPQSGRYRQFHQFGAEAIGDPDPEQDFEIIDMLVELYRRLGMRDLTVMINTLGTPHCRSAYRERLLAFLRPKFDALTPESRVRFKKNPLRILDSKDPEERALIESAPSILEFLDRESREHFDTLCALLKDRGVPFAIAPHLVRGLDYYNRTVFEITSDLLGAQNAIGAGGRYDGLLKKLGGPDLPSVGFSTGIERILQTMIGQGYAPPPSPPPFSYIIPIGNGVRRRCFSLLYELRHLGIPSQIARGKTLHKSLQEANRLKTPYAILLGEEELERGVGNIKAMEREETEEVPLDQLIESLEKKWNDHGLQKNTSLR